MAQITVLLLILPLLTTTSEQWPFFCLNGCLYLSWPYFYKPYIRSKALSGFDDKPLDDHYYVSITDEMSLFVSYCVARSEIGSTD